ncbi:MAG: DUF3450 domain-containing protein [Robiginitomaculum sp.]
MSNISIAKYCLLVGTAVAVFASPAHAQLDSVMRVAKGSTAASAASQQRIEKADDEAESMLRKYHAVLQQIDSTRLFVDKQDVYLKSQQQILKSVKTQLSNVEQTKRDMIPMMLRMTIAIEDSIKADMPFQLERRLARIERLKAALANPDVSPAEQYRQVLSAYKNEVTYGLNLDTYEGAHPTKSGMKVRYLQYGRLALVYMTMDSSEIAFYDMRDGSWKPIDKSHALSIRQAMRIAGEKAAPDVVMVPVYGSK